MAVDGIVQGSRPRDLLPASLDQLVLGARVYSNAPPPPWVQGFLEGEIAEALFYERALSDEESAQVISHLKRKQGPLLDGLAFRRDLGETAGDASRVKLVPETPGGADGPAVEILVPGFEVKELPLELRNVNNLRYRTSPDDEAAAPTLVALSYDGRILLLRDSDGDELEDDVSVFWDRPTLRAPIGMALTPPGYRHGFGVFVASKGKLSLIVDKDGDDRADDEIIVATGWPELPHGVDTLGVAVGRDESIYFGLGCTNYTNAYLIDPRTKKAGYRLDSERGTILRVSPDFSRREIVCTGIRFPVGLAFNRHGDLFATDQEGETWLPGGNPRDELLHILPARHYGFPPRHAEHLPDVVDEPSVFDYGPQHQSTCGLVFNEPEEGRPSFGPAHFAGNVFVAGYSRGIIYRTQLHRRDGDPARYTARTSLFARLGLLTVDACLSPRGDLVVATHSGGPDWGSGPQGEGKLFRIRHVDREAPQPIAAWAESPLETRVTFDRPISPESIDELDVEITYGDAVRAADRFEVHRPPYEVVVAQLEAPRYRLPVEGTT
ncbi:MAG TPA: hypothetical protein VK116_04780, partial [Planctomycetota bacterium]|nr:hypothetical protein [Planctomycetota bacterium]